MTGAKEESTVERAMETAFDQVVEKVREEVDRAVRDARDKEDGVKTLVRMADGIEDVWIGRTVALMWIGAGRDEGMAVDLWKLALRGVQNQGEKAIHWIAERERKREEERE